MKMQVAVGMNRAQAQKFKLLDADMVQLKQGNGTAVLPLRIDDGVPDGCVLIPGGVDAARHLHTAYGTIELEMVT